MAGAESGKVGGEVRSAWREEDPREEGFTDLGGMLWVYSESTGTTGCFGLAVFQQDPWPTPLLILEPNVGLAWTHMFIFQVDVLITSEQRREPLLGQPGAWTRQDPSVPSGWSPPRLSTSAAPQPHLCPSVVLSRVSLPCTIVPECGAQARAILPSALNLPSSQSHLVSSACSVNPPPPHPCPEKTIHRLTRAHSPTG